MCVCVCVHVTTCHMGRGKKKGREMIEHHERVGLWVRCVSLRLAGDVTLNRGSVVLWTNFKASKTSGPNPALPLSGHASPPNLFPHDPSLRGFLWVFQVMDLLHPAWYPPWGAGDRNCAGLAPWHRAKGLALFRTGQNTKVLLCPWMGQRPE